MTILRYLLLPFSLIYRLITGLRNHLYNIGLKPAIDFEVPTVVIGNLNVGGSGKTPMTELLIEQLKDDFKIGVISRGYGRNTRGFILADDAALPATIGDEPYQIYRKFKNDIVVAVGEERAVAIPYMLAENENIQLILLDDAYQHRAVKGTFNVLLTDYAKPFYDDALLPAGRLREAPRGANRANAIIVTKVPENCGGEEKGKIAINIKKYAADVPVFFAGIRYESPEAVNVQLPTKKIALVTGIANALPLKKYLSDRYEIVKHFRFPDHHRYTQQEVVAIARFCEAGIGTQLLPILTTEKDFVKLSQPELCAYFGNVPLYYQPMAMFLYDNGQEKLLAMIKAAIQDKSLN